VVVVGGDSSRASPGDGGKVPRTRQLIGLRPGFRLVSIG
jgi:hypothetical protein